jgi:hypothetical protein
MMELLITEPALTAIGAALAAGGEPVPAAEEIIRYETWQQAFPVSVPWLEQSEYVDCDMELYSTATTMVLMIDGEVFGWAEDNAVAIDVCRGDHRMYFRVFRPAPKPVPMEVAA